MYCFRPKALVLTKSLLLSVGCLLIALTTRCDGQSHTTFDVESQAPSPAPSHGALAVPNHCKGTTTEAVYNVAEAIERILDAIEIDSSTVVESVLCKGVDPNVTFETYSSSLLIEAAIYDAVKSAQVLLRFDADLEYRDDFGETALSVAAIYGASRVAILLLEHGANLENADDGGNTPLGEATWSQQSEVMQVQDFLTHHDEADLVHYQILLDNGANVDSSDESGWTALHIASYQNCTQCAKILIEAGAELDVATDAGFTTLHVAAEHN